MAYAPSPRPTFPGPAPIPYATVTRHLWGDGEAGEVADWIYVSSDKIHQLVFGLAPGATFCHSDSYRTLFAADILYYVLSGTLVLANPEKGEVRRVLPGEAVFFRRDTWHHAINFSTEPLRVLEFFAPPPSQGTSGAYARTKPNLTEWRYARDDLLGRWPMEQAQVKAESTLHVIRDSDLLWRLEGNQVGKQQALAGLLIATEHLTVGKMQLLAGGRSAVERHGGDESLYVLEGTLNIFLPEHDGQRWHELGPRDGFYVPAGVPHQYYSMTGPPPTFVFGVAPCYQAG
jgi:quercetin dioxygenase-like cupin family protein